jgi:tRNA threonylcarbamoyladenosine biosynthesis protein TsaE
VNDTLLSVSEADTLAAGRALGQRLRQGDVVLVHGQLGAGKTAFIRGIASALGIAPEEVSSPTFTLVHEYRGTVTLYHADLYRLERVAAEDLGLGDFLAGGGIVAIEWPERLIVPLTPAIKVSIDAIDETTRRISYSMR